MRTMVDSGELDALVPERVWQELRRALASTRPSAFLSTLRDCGALAVVLPEVDALYGIPQRAEYHPEVDTGIHQEMVCDMAARTCLITSSGLALGVPLMAMYTEGMPSNELIES